MKCFDNGEKKKDLCRVFFGVNEFTICTVKKNQKGIRASVSRGTPESLRKSHITRNPKI